MSRGTITAITWGLFIIMLIINPREDWIHKCTAIVLSIATMLEFIAKSMQ